MKMKNIKRISTETLKYIKEETLRRKRFRFRRFLILLLVLFPVFCSLLPISCFLSPDVYANFEDNGVGARWIGMNNAGTALSDDVFALHYNPSGLAGIYWKELGLDYAKLFWGLDDGSGLSNGFIGYVNGFKDWGTFGF